MATMPETVTPGAVALLAEGVDRNAPIPSALQATLVALLAEGVDRNLTP